MASDAPLFDPPTERRHNGGGETLGDRVLREIRASGERGMIDEQLVDAFASKGQPHKESTLQARRRELVDAGLVVKSSSRRKTIAGVNAAVWIAAEFAQAAAATPPVSRKKSEPPRTMQGGELRPAATPCRDCGATAWRYPPAGTTGPQPVTCAGCGKFIGNHTPTDQGQR